jgi:DNA polymerase-3 subunit alpha
LPVGRGLVITVQLRYDPRGPSRSSAMIQIPHTVPFVHLWVQSAYSIGVGVSTPTEICAYAKRYGFDAVALTDVGGTWGYVEFHRAADRYGVKPIYGVMLGLAGPDGGPEPVLRLALIAVDRSGLENVCLLTSIAGENGSPPATVRLADLESRADGVVCVVSAHGFDEEIEDGLIPELQSARPVDIVEDLRRVFGQRLYVGLEPGGDDDDGEWVAAANELGVSRVLTQDVRYVGFKHYSLSALEKGEVSPEVPDRPRSNDEPVDRYRFLALSEVTRWYEGDREAYTNASIIASLVRADLLHELDAPVPPSEYGTLFEPGSGYQEEFEREVRNRFDRLFADPADRERWREILEGELEAVRASRTAESFLRFHKVISQLRRHHIPVGPATGLQLQSLCAFLLGITAFNPYEVDRHFQATLFDERAARRILDLQVASSDRSVTVSVLEQLFADVSVGYVPTVEHVTPLRALKVAGREVDIDEKELDEISRIASEHPGVPLVRLCEENPRIGRLHRKSASVRELIATAAAIEGLPLGFVRSKRTLIVSPRPLDQFIAHDVNPETGDRFYHATRDVFPTESVFRIDISTLTSLGVCARVSQYLEGEGEDTDGWTAPIDRPDGAYEEFTLLAKGDLDGIYLLESPLTQRLAVDFGVTSFASLTRFLALMRYRRGDLSFAGRVEAFQKGPPAADGPDSDISFLLNETNGWILFDDQLREILSALTGLRGPEAATLFRRFRRHDAASLAALRKDFMARTVEAEVPLEEAVSWFKKLLFYASRTLDRQPILADALLVHRTLRLKLRHRAAFFAELLNEHRTHGGRFDVYLGIVESEGLLLSPDVNRSGLEYRPERGLIRPPLTRIEGLGDRAVRAILRARGDREFDDLEDFIRRVPSQFVTNEDVEAIVAAGAVGAGEQLGKAPGAVPPAGASQGGAAPLGAADRTGQLEFGLDGGAASKAPPTKKVGNMRIGHHVLPTVAEFYPHPSGARVELVGRVRDLQTFNTSSGDETRFFVLFDASASVPVFAPSGRVGRTGEPLADGVRVLVRGIVRVRDRRKVCDAVEVLTEGGATSDGETTPDEPAEGNP